MVGGTTALQRTVGFVTMMLLCAQTTAQTQTEPSVPASTELLLYLAEFESDADPVELTELERKRAVTATPEDRVWPAESESKRDTELAHEPK